MDALQESPQAGRQAFLVLAHEVNSVFTALIQMLDHPETDIFIHMDEKNTSYNPAETLKLVKYSRIFHTPRIKVSWGAYSQTEAELILLEAATSKGHYGHYHLLSGADLSIKKVNEIIDFFKHHDGEEFVSFRSDTFEHPRWVKYYHLFQECSGRRTSPIINGIHKLCILLQMITGVHRNKCINFQKGSQWFSITDEFARYILSKRDWISKTFAYTLHSEEIFLQTLTLNSEFINNLYHKEFDDDILSSSMRLIDWKRKPRPQNSPYTFRVQDLDEIKDSPAMFARKFSPSVDAEIIEKVRELYS